MRVDVTSGSLVHSLISLAWPSVLQAILSNCYAFNDYIFVGHIPDKEASAAATAAMAATGIYLFIYFNLCIKTILIFTLRASEQFWFYMSLLSNVFSFHFIYMYIIRVIFSRSSGMPTFICLMHLSHYYCW